MKTNDLIALLAVVELALVLSLAGTLPASVGVIAALALGKFVHGSLHEQA